MSSLLPASNASLPPSEPVNRSTTKHLPGDGKIEKLSALKFRTEDHLREIWDGQERKRKGIGGRNGPLQLLDLSVDVLKVIINEITHTNDLTSLALTCSALHGLAIPSIYSRFDIVWPDVHSNSDSRQGVDALTYGLATLVMGDEPCYATQTGNYNFEYCCAHCGIPNVIRTSPQFPGNISRRRRGGNYYPQYTSKFSLGNGPQEWIKEYLINRDSGKMLGTLVALALERMPMLQDFTWDMPTGILRDCWLALAPDSSIGSSPLQRVWVRFHDNREIMDAPQILPTASQGNHYSPGNPPGPSQTQSSNYYFNGIQCPSPLIWSYRHIEWPNFSVLPPLRSLNVLNIDEIAYLEEMGVLIERSMGEMRELRIGLADKVPRDGFASTRDLDFPVVDEEPTEYESALRRLMGKLLEVEEQDCPKSSDSNALPSPVATTHIEESSLLGSQNLMTNPRLTPSSGHEASNKISDGCTNLPGGVPQVDSTSDPAGVLASLVIKAQVNPISNKSIPGTVEDSTVSFLSAPSIEEISYGVSAIASESSTKTSSSSSNNAAKQDRDKENCSIAKMPTSVGGKGPDRTQQEKRLRLEILELEYMHVDFGVLLKTIDWSVLTTLTLLHCDSSEGLWRALRRAFTPRPMPSQPILRRKSKMQLRDFSSKNLHGVPPSEYQLNLRRIHINSVSAALIAFLRETLAPDSLELLFLQDGGTVSNSSGGRGPYDSNVSIEAIFNGPLRRHRHSLKKLMIDSDDRPVNSRRKSAKWQKWRLDRNMLAFVTSGKLSVLRELAISIDYQDWHFFLQRLPQVPHIRSIYLRHGADHPHEQHFNAKELALQLMDIVSIRPEMELCYLGIANKCFEIIEGEEAALPVHGSLTAAATPGLEYATSTDEDSDEGEDDDDDDENEDGQTAHAPDDSDVDSQPESVEFSEDEGTGLDGSAKIPRLELREILFYDDKISIFKARHSKL